MKQKRIKYIDALRVIAIISVVAIHVFADFRDTYINTNRLYYGLITLLDSFTRMGVPIFFMITGAFMLSKKETKKYSQFLKQRLPKLLIPFFIISIIYFIYEGITQDKPLTVIEFIKQFTSSGGVKYHFWFIYIIILIYIFIPFIKVLVQNLKRNELRNLIIVIFILGNVLKTINLYTSKIDITLFTGITLKDITIYSNYVLLGYYLYNYDIKQNTRKKIYIIGILCILLIPIADLLLIDNMRNDVILGSTSCFPLIPSMALFLLLKYQYNNWNIPKIIDKIEQKSAPLIFYIYMIHVLIMELITKQLQKIWIPNRFIERGLYYFIIFLSTVILSYIIAIIFHKIYSFCEHKIKKIRN